MATQTQTTPQLTVLSRVASIPLVNDSLSQIHSTLSSYAITRAPYSAAQIIGSTAYRVSEPIQMRLAPVIVRADGYANAAVDMVESRYPYPFRTKTEDIYEDIKKNGDYAVNVANKTLDERVKTPAYGIAQDIDQRFTPVVDRLEVVVSKIQGQSSPTQEPRNQPEYQYQRAYQLSLDLKDSLYCYTTEQIKQIQEHNVLVQRATATAQSFNETLSTSYGAAQARVHALSDKMLLELCRLQSSTAALPSHLQASLAGLSEGVTHTIGELTAIIKSDVSMDEKANMLKSTIGQKIQPLLETAATTLQDAVKVVTRRSSDATQPQPQPTENGTAGPVNGKANGSAY